MQAQISPLSLRSNLLRILDKLLDQGLSYHGADGDLVYGPAGTGPPPMSRVDHGTAGLRMAQKDMWKRPVTIQCMKERLTLMKEMERVRMFGKSRRFKQCGVGGTRETSLVGFSQKGKKW